MKNKLLVTTALVGGLLTGSSFAQTTVTGDLALTYNALNKKIAGGLSTRGVGRESQLNIQNKGKLNNGMDYAAGFSLEFDGTGSSSNTVLTTPDHSVSNENVYIDLISGNTTFTIGVDHIQRGYAGAAPMIVNITDQMAGAGSSTTFVIGAGTSESAGVGIMQKVPQAGITASAYYAPRSKDTGVGDMNALVANSGANSSYEVGINGVDTFGVKGLTVVAFYNSMAKSQSTFSGDVVGKQYGVGYNFGQFAIGIDKLIDKNNNLAAAAPANAMGEAAEGITRDTRRIALSYAVTPTFSLALVEAKTEISDRVSAGVAATTGFNGTETVRALQAGYNLGPVAVTASHNKFTNLAGRTGAVATDDGSLSILRLSTKF
jgi:hypothetical protein